MSADTLISRLRSVKQTGAGRWMASCPAHEDRRPSLNVAEKSDGRVLLHCFGGCGAADVLVAVGLDWNAVMPERINTLSRESEHRGRKRYRSEPRPFNAHDVLACLGTETRIAYIVLHDVIKGIAPSDKDLLRFDLAVQRILAAESLING